MKKIHEKIAAPVLAAAAVLGASAATAKDAIRYNGPAGMPIAQAVEASLKSMNLGMGDVVKMQIFLVGDPAHEGKMDFGGMMEGYRQFFGTKEQPNLPARSVVKVAGLANPGWLVEIEVTAMRK